MPKLHLHCLATAGALALWLGGSAAHAEESKWGEPEASSMPEPIPPVFDYEVPVRKNYLRAVIELQAVFATGLLYYMTTSDRNWDLGYRWDTYEHKFRWEAFGPDHNHFGTNFIGHPLGGAGYYVAARSNQLGVFESFAFAFAGSLLWEYFGEITERVSLNDIIVTPAGGVAIGEATTQLGAFFDRSSPAVSNRALGVVFGPFKSLNDWGDAAKTHRSSVGFAADGWHRFDFRAGALMLRTRGSASPAPRAALLVEASETLAHLPDYDDAGRHGFWFDEGNVSSMAVSATLDDGGFSSFDFDSRVLLAGYYMRDAGRVHGALSGSGVVIGPSTAFEYSLHDFGASFGADRLAYVQPLALSLLYRVSLGATTLETSLHAGPSLGGITALAQEAYAGSELELPEVLRLHSYYLGAGGDVSTGARLGAGPFEIAADLRGDGYEVIQDRPPTGDVSVRDTRLRSSVEIGWLVPRSPLVVRALGRHVLRRGAMGPARAEASELSLGLSFGGLF